MDRNLRIEDDIMESGKTFEEELKDVKEGKRGKIKVTLTMNDVPLPLVEEFCSDVMNRYNDSYWVKLQDLMRKAQAYDYIVNVQNSVYMDVPEQDVDLEQDKDDFGEVRTMGDVVKVKKRRTENAG